MGTNIYISKIGNINIGNAVGFTLAYPSTSGEFICTKENSRPSVAESHGKLYVGWKSSWWGCGAVGWWCGRIMGR